ncbi:MAG: M23 family metallopeptidase [Dysgonamonadaceae bacterium]|jgi:hypothetical protein|nr:M23 family metallopeptidase [Dysgonamonadaceae bacterium]MDD3308491.1 M23 family metallopeptidase [Dysgonamonadaceae bacterium]MDD3899647.1 M23 family metallopeptidase [Dysgonamonadaceae bacterium]MDD4398160.1 M23 family metallopeptidase [Dysgonamonadaceae bacterium]MEA5081851.1 M23 family metallopeptidase [Dysgonamonadaceae bacterium]
MNSNKLRTGLLFLITFFTLASYSQNYIYPLKLTPALSANFGELRNNHFHSGIDFKTQQVINKPVYTIDDGYISRISVSPGGYGLALYINHPTGHTSVYAHLNSFSKKIADYVKAKQYEYERFQLNLDLQPGEMPVKKGEQIALSGNTGGSGGPHLHFEIRETKSESPLNPLNFLSRIPDTQKPDLRGIAFYPVSGKGVVNGGDNPVRLTISKNSSGVPLALSRTIEAWGKIGVGVKTYDKMNGQENIYGVKNIRLYVDEEEVFSSSMNKFSFDKTRMLNSFIDFEDWRINDSFIMKSFVEPGNTLQLYKTVNNGYIDINEERDYRMRYELEDDYGNTLTYSFIVIGKKQLVPQPVDCNNYMGWNFNNSYIDVDFMLNIPAGNLYSDICYSHSKILMHNGLSNMHRIHNRPVPLHNGANIWIKITTDSIVNKQNYGIVKIGENGHKSWIGGTYENGGVETSINELGDKYMVAIDTIPPTIAPQSPESWVKNRRISIRLSDDLSGIGVFRGEIDGTFALFSHDIKSNIYTYLFDNERLPSNQPQELIFSVTDGVGNKSIYQYKFTY